MIARLVKLKNNGSNFIKITKGSIKKALWMIKKIKSETICSQFKEEVTKYSFILANITI